MKDAAAFRASYSDWKPIKTRRVIQIVFEVPWENHDEAYQALGGMPDPGSERWFAIARLQEPAKPKPLIEQHKPWSEYSPAEQAGILCNDETFQRYLKQMFPENWKILNEGTDADRAAEIVRWRCGVSSRKFLTTSNREWCNLVATYHRTEPEYKPRDDFAKSIDACYSAVRERVAVGGPTWKPK